jgi:hypothetical protein
LFTNFQSFSKSTLLFEIRFYRQAPGTFVSITDRPLVHEKDLGKNEGDAMWSLGREGGAARRNWAAPAAPLAGEGVEEDEGLTCCRFVAGVWVGAAPEMACGGGVRRQPLHLSLWRAPSRGQAMSGRAWQLELPRALEEALE